VPRIRILAVGIQVFLAAGLADERYAASIGKLMAVNLGKIAVAPVGVDAIQRRFPLCEIWY